MPRMSTKDAMQSKLERLDNDAKTIEHFTAGFTHGVAIAAPVNERPIVSHDLQRGGWGLDENGRRVWKRAP